MSADEQHADPHVIEVNLSDDKDEQDDAEVIALPVEQDSEAATPPDEPALEVNEEPLWRRRARLPSSRTVAVRDRLEMPYRLRINLGNQGLEWLSVRVFKDQLAEADTDERAWMEMAIEEGVIATIGDKQPAQVLSGHALKRMRSRLRPDHLDLFPEWDDLDEATSREHPGFMIPDLLVRGANFVLAGTSGAGKTEVLCDLGHALVLPEHRFLDHFAPTEMTDQEWDDGVLLINAETAPWRIEQLTEQAQESGRLRVVHLSEIGGPETFDLTDKANFRAWRTYLYRYDSTDAREWASAVTIVDGLTAILGSDTSRYALWYAQFLRLMLLVGTPTTGVSVHTTMKGDHAMGGTEAASRQDMTWRYVHDQDDTTSKRRFSTTGKVRTGMPDPIPDTEVTRVAGRLHLGPISPTPADVPTSPTEAGWGHCEQVLTRAGAAGALTTEITGSGRDGKINRAALRAAQAATPPLVVSRPDGRSVRWWLLPFAPVAV